MERKYAQAVPAGYESEASDEDMPLAELINGDNKKFEIIKSLKKHRENKRLLFSSCYSAHFSFLTGGDIPDIGFRAGIDGSHFNIKLTTEMQQKFDALHCLWDRKLAMLVETGI